MLQRSRIVAASLFLGLIVVTANGQERNKLTGDAAKDTPPPGVDKFYYDLSQSKDRSVKAAAERYLNLVKLQEWNDLSGQFKTVARYVKHDANLTSVTIEIVKGRGAERTTEQKTVPVDKLSKTCQSRVRQIDAAQKKLQELAAAKPGENGAPPARPDGAPMHDDRGEMPRGPGATAGTPPSPAPPAAEAAPDPSASDPDPLGFAELPSAPVAPPAGPPPVGPPPEGNPPPGSPSRGP